MRLGILTSHPIQYQAPWFRGLAKEVELEVFFAHRPDASQQGRGFGKAFSWDVDLLSGYQHQFLGNISSRPSPSSFFGCDTPEIREIIFAKRKAERRSQGSAVCGQSSVVSRRFDAFVVSGWHLKCFWQAVRACRAAGIPILVRGDSQLLTPRSRLKTWIKEIGYRLMLRQFDGFLVVGQRNREYLAHYGVPSGKMFFAPHFVDNEWFGREAEIARKQKIENRKSWGAEGNTFVVLFVGKFQPLKQQSDIIKALAWLNNSSEFAPAPAPKERVEPANQPFSFLAVFVGSGELEAALREEAAKSKVCVHFAGFKNQSELPACYAAADVLVLPSNNETWGLVVNEAMACGIPAIVSDAVGCAPDMIEQGKTGFTFPAGNAVALAERLATLAKMKSAGHDFTPALKEKLQVYSLEQAVAGTMTAAAGARMDDEN